MEVAHVRRMLAAVALAALAAPCATALAHQGNPNFRSNLRSVTPRVPGLDVEVLNLDDRLQLINRSGKTVEIDGYNGDVYARIEADGTVQLNRRSPAYYLNQERFATVDVPASADPKAAPQWQTVDKTARFEWHDHRIHWMGKGLPPAVTDKSTRTKIFDWRVPVRVGGRPGAIAGTLTWVGEPGGGPPAGAIVAFVGMVLAGGAAVVVVRRRRRTTAEAW
jgi:hypothetical protein